MNVQKEVSALENMTVHELREKHVDVFGEPTGSHNKRYLLKRIAWRIQANAEGGLSERALKRARDLADDADIRMNPPRTSQKGVPGEIKIASVPVKHDDRIPMPGTVITREYKGRTIQVMVLTDGFEFEGESYSSLTAIAKEVTGSHWNGYHFFKLNKGRNGND